MRWYGDTYSVAMAQAAQVSGHGGVGLMAGLDAVSGLFQP